MKYLVSIIVGAAIGYFTNWLAIKMLFRPHEEKRVFGLKVPFTPGLIPKERYRISKSVGDAIGEHLLTEDTISKSLKKVEVKNAFKNLILNKLSYLIKEDNRAEEVLKSIFKQRYEGLKSGFIKKTSNVLLSYIRSEEVKEKIYISIENELLPSMKVPLYDYFSGEKGSNIKDTLIKEVYLCLESNSFKENINKVIKDKINKKIESNEKVKDVLPEDMLEMGKTYAYNHRDEIVNEIKIFIQKKDMEDSIKDILTDAIRNKLNPMVAMFINVDSLYEKAMPIILENLEKEKFKIKLISFINNEIDKIKEKEISEVLSELSLEEVEKIQNTISNMIQIKLLNERLVKNLIDSLEQELQKNEVTIEALCNKFKINRKEIYMNLYNKIINSKEIEINIENTLIKVANNLLQKNVKELIHLENIYEYFKGSNQWIEDVYNKTFDSQGTEIIKALNISQMVEEKLNELDVEFTEKIILDIANKELKAITWLGGLLGGIIGIITPIINSIF